MIRSFLIALMLATPVMAETLDQQNARMFDQIEQEHAPSPAQMQRLREIFAASGFVGQGNPAIARHPMTPEECAARVPGGPDSYDDPRNARICGDRFMAPLYDPATQSPEDATACIDMFEYPNIPCSYPVVWVKAREAALICDAMGKRLCDAHEWEGACAGALTPPDYRYDLGSVAAMRNWHNATYAPTKNWAYGDAYQRGVCAAASAKSDGCGGGGFNSCGSNTYPTGAFPGCVSALGVYDQHGNAAEHMNLPMRPDQMASTGSSKLGVTEMKGSWFIFDRYYAHQDWCRWRAPYWHGGPVMSTSSHANYHLGFRCCKTVE
ncbi:SUMF1/EgtB/PvdO family nonheme iron enzyme [Aliiroseovarius subalbicans]|uniref:SUMF1/EgtB/PvdO family nonheme iron enzyme n=1 Tax=Aliiroseovarius subalbicans TaxID=2925840 RepID=UPI001F57BAD5|nr:SUMF1/EgtB/PvdO family nonheme iron enzyme [Aliiroseovarius subalbicans]MCI2398935.1 formylglycine-generating enzyme family protein [Aliiroseovarius subalbicans]